MKIKFIKNIDNRRALSFINDYSESNKLIPITSFIQSPYWTEIQDYCGIEAFNIAAINESEEIIGIAFCSVIRAKRGKYLYIRNGPLLNYDDEKLTIIFINELKKIAKNLGLWFVRISPLVMQNSIYSKSIKKVGGIDCPVSDVEALDTRILSLEGTIDELFALIKKKTRYLIRQAEKINLVAEVYFDNSKFEDFYKIFEKTVERKKWNSVSKEYIKKEFETFLSDGNAYMVLVRKGEEYLSGGIFIKYINQAVYHYGASIGSNDKVPLAYLMLWQAIKTAKERGCDFFNYWGVSPEGKSNHPWYGLSMFKRKFPGFEQHWHRAQDIPVSYKYFFTRIVDIFDKKRKGY